MGSEHSEHQLHDRKLIFLLCSFWGARVTQKKSPVLSFWSRQKFAFFHQEFLHGREPVCMYCLAREHLFWQTERPLWQTRGSSPFFRFKLHEHHCCQAISPSHSSRFHHKELHMQEWHTTNERLSRGTIINMRVIFCLPVGFFVLAKNQRTKDLRSKPEFQAIHRLFWANGSSTGMQNGVTNAIRSALSQSRKTHFIWLQKWKKLKETSFQWLMNEQNKRCFAAHKDDGATLSTGVLNKANSFIVTLQRENQKPHQRCECPVDTSPKCADIHCRRDLFKTFLFVSLKSWKMPNHINNWGPQTAEIVWQKSGKYPTTKERWAKTGCVCNF